MENERDEVVIDLRELFYVLKDKLLVIIITGLIFALGSGLVSQFVLTPEYKATSKLYIITQSTSITSLADIQMGSTLASDYLELIKSRPVVEDVIDNLSLKIKYEKMLQKMSIENPADTRILNISIQDEDPLVAKDIANEFAEVSKKRISLIMKTDEPNIVEDAIVSKKPVSPDKKKNVAIATLLGLMLAAGIVVVRYLMDDTIKSTDDVEKYLGLNTLAMIPIIEEDSIDMHKDTKKKKNKMGGKHHD